MQTRKSEELKQSNCYSNLDSCISHSDNSSKMSFCMHTFSFYDGCDFEWLGCCSASSPKSANVRTTRSTFSRNAFTVSRANRIVNVLKVLCDKISMSILPLTIFMSTYAMRTSSSTARMRSTACGCSSASTSMAFFAIIACFGDANGIRVVL